MGDGYTSRTEFVTSAAMALTGARTPIAIGSFDVRMLVDMHSLYGTTADEHRSDASFC